MALIKCPKCGKEFSDRAQVCPQCGFTIKAIKPIQLTLVIMGLLVFVLCSLCFFGPWKYEYEYTFLFFPWCWRIFLCSFWLSKLFMSYSKERYLAILGLVCCILWIGWTIYGQITFHPWWSSADKWCELLIGILILVYGRFLNGIRKYLAIISGVLILYTQITLIIRNYYEDYWMTSRIGEIYSSNFLLVMILNFLTYTSIVAFVISCNTPIGGRRLWG